MAKGIAGNFKPWATQFIAIEEKRVTCLENFKKCIKQQYMTPKDEFHGSEGIQYATGEQWRTTTNSPQKKEAGGPKQLWMCLVIEVKFDVTNNRNA